MDTESLDPMIDRVFGRLVVLERITHPGGNIYYNCRCQCGKIVAVRGSVLRQGRQVSCGCEKLNVEKRIRAAAKVPTEKRREYGRKGATVRWGSYKKAKA